MARKRWKRKSGYVTPKLTIKRKQLEQNNLFLNPSYNDWEDWRDSQRDLFRDFKLIKNFNEKEYPFYSKEIIKKRLRMNLKQIKLKIRRKNRKKANLT